jgi:ubiquinone/menaquinone biosynthesis C-methylase UbiE
MEDIKQSYTAEHTKHQNTPHWYPTEWIIRTMVGNYPKLYLDKTIYQKKPKILDMGFGDGRNFLLLKNLGLKIHGVEITQEIVNTVQKKTLKNNIDCELKVGDNLNIPYPDNYFDIILASSSMYYLENEQSFDAIIKEYMRVLKKGGILIANFPEKSKSYICQGSIQITPNIIEIKNDPHKLRNGNLFYVFNTKDEIENTFDNLLNKISIAYLYEDYYDYILSMFILVGYKK